ncbi:MAG: sensor domain-containing diguanylate cyclase [Nitrospirae bacterium]|nr:sensor domain-containing diguanylate cyclase [Nitrospirota bacterium]
MAKQTDNRVEDFLDTILDINNILFSTLDTKSILYLIVKKISEVMHVARCSIILIDKERHIGNILATFEDPALDTLSIDLIKYPEIVKSVEDEETVIIRDVGVDPVMRGVRENLLGMGIRSIMVIPIRYTEGAIGALYLRTSRKDAVFSERDIKLCQVIADSAAVALKNAHLFNVIKEEKTLLEKMAVTDDLTRLYNHRYFVRRLGEEFKRARRYKNSISCVMLDIDNFKKVNDTYGHQSGDWVLQEVAKVIRDSVRETDVVARYGGEEFAVILPHTGREDAIKLAERIRQSIKGFRFDAVGNGEQITASMGVATYPDTEIRDIDDLVRKADNGLYKAKSNGKDMVVSL